MLLIVCARPWCINVLGFIAILSLLLSCEVVKLLLSSVNSVVKAEIYYFLSVWYKISPLLCDNSYTNCMFASFDELLQSLFCFDGNSKIVSSLVFFDFYFVELD